MTKNIKEIEMKNISVHIKKGEKTTFTFKKPIATYGTRIAAKEVTVFWNFRNITSTIGNNTFIRKKSENGGTDETKTINDGYYDFEQLKTRLAGEKLELQMKVVMVRQTGSVSTHQSRAKERRVEMAL